MAPFALKLKEKGSHVVIYDLWGHGLSSTPLTSHVPAIFHTQILELLSYLNWRKAHIFGFSMGGSIAATFAALHPQCVESLTLAVPAGWPDLSDVSLLERILVHEGCWGLQWFRRRTILDFMVEGKSTPEPDWKERLKKGEVDLVAVQLWERQHHKGHVQSLVSMWDGLVFGHGNTFALLPKSGFECLVILGEKDPVIKPDQVKESLAKMSWVGDIHVIEGAGHDVVRPFKDETVKLVEDFWERLGV